jgi:hypothetical protein
VRVTGSVARSCIGPIVVGRAQRCFDRAVFEHGGRRWTVHAAFAIRLPRGVYEVTVDACTAPQRLLVTRRISGLRLVPHWVAPL